MTGISFWKKGEKKTFRFTRGDAGGGQGERGGGQT